MIGRNSSNTSQVLLSKVSSRPIHKNIKTRRLTIGTNINRVSQGLRSAPRTGIGLGQGADLTAALFQRRRLMNGSPYSSIPAGGS